MGKVFLVPGLGADYRAFKNIDFGSYETVPVTWIIPDKTDTLTSYAQKLIENYQITGGSIVAGNSLGGMLTIEIAKKVKLDKAILISSIKTIVEAPNSFKWYRRIPIYKLIPAKIYTSSGFFALKFVMGLTSKKASALFIDMLRNTPPVFAKWAIGAILHWDNNVVPENVYHIHGDKDKIFPYKALQDATIIQGGTHIMIFNRAKEINTWLKNILPL
ncbi:MAG TPA: alpha/beta hydrolase [Mucilaginibacter sp.]|nr:alpha/beta hydrolase [Mucilaginibacter sp.]